MFYIFNDVQMDEEQKEIPLDSSEIVLENIEDVDLWTSYELVMNSWWVWDGDDEKKQEGSESGEKPEKRFTFSPIALSTAWAIKNEWGEFVNTITTTLEFAGWWKNMDVYGYVRKDWNKYAKWFNEWFECFANEEIKLWKNFNLNGKQFYWWNWVWRIMFWPQISMNEQIWKVNLWASVWWYVTYDFKPDKTGKWSWTSIASVNFSVEQKNWKTRDGNAFLSIWSIKGLDYQNYSTYWEAKLTTPNLLNPEEAGALCWILYARYWWTLKEIKLQYLWVWLTYKF